VQPAISAFCQFVQSPHFKATSDRNFPARAFAAWASAQAGNGRAVSAHSWSTVADASSAVIAHGSGMLLLDRAARTGMPEAKARQNAAHHAEHPYYEFAFGTFRYKGLEQHFWQPFEVRYRLRRAGFRRVRMAKVHLSWQQFGCARDLGDQPPWYWFFQAGP
jgi:hypothetical protein